MSTMSDYERIRLVILGGQGVGKSCIIKRFLFNTYCNKYRSTVEDLYNKEYDLGHMTLKVDILDTAGDMQFPAMRRLCIATAHAFLLVYSVASVPSFDCVKQCFEEIRENRNDYQDIPIVVAGNKLDLTTSQREITIEDVSEWVYCELPKLRVKVLECSAKDDINIKEIFRSLLTLSKLLPRKDPSDTGTGLKRRSSAYVSATSKDRRRAESPLLEADKASGSGSGCLEGIQPSKPRSRSLIRRASRKTKQQIRDAQVNECNVS
ncbi:GTP-binding protein Di-Ras1 [Dendroctonus ponderosae]|uniref:GTP-binding protein Di-Ras2 n=2 Tax=Dendroctonus ponderosae TaxID=77166 RepID=A0AAR5Q5N8_DENPD|nr:GTP-binding protein Di-Ras1 [Dendroctonus ponderosae]